jgi:dTDP-4-amino-4,6-dideoxygalactose transaminase
MRVPILDPVEGNAPYQKAVEEAALRVLRGGNFVMGKDISVLEATCERKLRVKHTLTVSSGTDALILALMANDIGPGDEVICPTFTFFATAGAIARVGATPVFVDVDYYTFNTTHDRIAAAITGKTKAIIPVHLFGQMVDMPALLKRLKNYKQKIVVIEDACQAIGSGWWDKDNSCFEQAGTWGNVGCFSFFPTKNVGGFGDGGLVTTNNTELYKKMKAMRVHGGTRQYYHDYVGGNFRMDTLQAAMLLPKFHPYFFANLRSLNAEMYLEALANHMYVLPFKSPNARHVWNQFTIRVPGNQRDELRDYLGKNGIASGVYYPLPLHQQPCFSHLPKKTLPVAEEACKECLSLPIAAELSELQIDYVISKLQLFEKGYR